MSNSSAKAEEQKSMKQGQVLDKKTGATEARASSSAGLPDINNETYPFEVVQRLLDEAAYFNLYSVPDASECHPLLDPASPATLRGFKLGEKFHRVSSQLSLPSPAQGLASVTHVGEAIGHATHRWILIPDDFAALPGVQPPPVALDASRSQRFVMLDSRFWFGEGEDGFTGFGTGTTYPTSSNGQKQLLVAGVGTIMEGQGRFKEHEGTYTYCGRISTRGFHGNLLLRVMDPEGSLRTDATLPTIQEIRNPEPGITYMCFRGQKRDHNQKTEYVFAADGSITGLHVTQQLRDLQVDCARLRGSHVRARAELGPVIGSMTAQITFNLLNPGAPGTPTSPIPFKSYNTYTFFDVEGREIGTIEADGGEGRTFNLAFPAAPGQRALRFGGFGPIVKGTGWFHGIEGLMTDNSVVGIAPHALATFYVLRINDPEGRFTS
jgi:hypothetical protein